MAHEEHSHCDGPQQPMPPLTSSTSSQHHEHHEHHSYVSGGGHELISAYRSDQRKKKMNYFVNALNYPREKVESILDQLGPDAADNDILECLVKVCRPSNMQMKALPSIGGIYHSGKGGGDPIAIPVTDPARLRHIVIDGSNVAMR